MNREENLRVRLVLVSPEGKINFGFILRLAKNFNVDEICVVNPQFDINDSEVLEFAARAKDNINKVRVTGSLTECISGVLISVCTTAKLNLEGDVLRQGIRIEELPHVIPRQGLIALVFGRESTGLTRDELRQCDIISTIDTGSEYNVLNLSHAVALYLHEVNKIREAPHRREVSYCGQHVLQAIRRYLDIIREATGDERGVIALKHVLFRSNMSIPECTAIYKLLKKITHKINQNAE